MKTTLLLLLVPCAVLAQTNAAVLTSVPSGTADWLNMLIAVVTPVVIAGVRWLLPKIPKIALPLIAPVIGVILDQLAGILTSHQPGVVAGAISGAVGLWLREAADQSRKHLAKTDAEVDGAGKQ
jgi:MFS superfamily sulfate permease-like transporter